MFSNEEQNEDPSFAMTGIAFGALNFNSPLMQLLVNGACIVPGATVGYQLCKTIYLYHPLGAVLTEAPVKRAMAKERDLSIPVVGEDRLIERFKDEWSKYGDEGADSIILDLMTQSRTYGLSTLVIDDGSDPEEPLDWSNIQKVDDVRFHVFDPLITSGARGLSQDPASRDFLRPGMITVKGVPYHPSRALTKMNEKPILYAWSPSAYGFVGRSVYLRAIYPLRTYVQSMITDQMIIQKAGLLVAMMKAAGSVINNIMQKVGEWKRGLLKAGQAGNVISIGVDEKIESLDLNNLEGPYTLARMNVIKNIATAAGMPASIIAQETLTEGFGEGTEDFKKEVQYLNHLRREMNPIFDFIDGVVMRRAWTPEFYATIQSDEPDAYQGVEYETALHQWIKAFSHAWPNLMEEPDSEKAKIEKVKMEAVIGVAEVALPVLDPSNQLNILRWVAENVNTNTHLFAGNLDLDEETLDSHLKEAQDREEEMAEADQEQTEADKVPREPRVRAA